MRRWQSGCGPDYAQILPVQKGRVQDWNLMERAWNRAIYQYLRCDPAEHAFLLVRCPLPRRVDVPAPLTTARVLLRACVLDVSFWCRLSRRCAHRYGASARASASGFGSPVSLCRRTVKPPLRSSSRPSTRRTCTSPSRPCCPWLLPPACKVAPSPPWTPSQVSPLSLVTASPASCRWPTATPLAALCVPSPSRART